MGSAHNLGGMAMQLVDSSYLWLDLVPQLGGNLQWRIPEILTHSVSSQARSASERYLARAQ